MHSRKKGKHGSKKPAKKTAPSWILYKGKEIELLIAKLSKEGKNPSQIGTLLRDTYGIPNVVALCGKSISAILEEIHCVRRVHAEGNFRIGQKFLFANSVKSDFAREFFGLAYCDFFV